MPNGHQAGKNDGNGGAELDQDVQRGAGGVLERVAHGVADDGGLVRLGALAAVVDVLEEVTMGISTIDAE